MTIGIRNVTYCMAYGVTVSGERHEPQNCYIPALRSYIMSLKINNELKLMLLQEVKKRENICEMFAIQSMLFYPIDTAIYSNTYALLHHGFSFLLLLAFSCGIAGIRKAIHGSPYH